MDFIYLKKFGLHLKKGKKFIPIDKTISCYLNSTPKIDKDFTVEDLMNILKENESDVDILFQSFTRGYELKPFFKEMNLQSLREDKSKISKIAFSWSGNVENIKEFGKPKFEISEYVQVSGKVASEKESYSLSFVNLNDIKNATFSTNKKIAYCYINYGDLWDENRKADKKIFFKGIKEFSLQDIIGSFLNEISFFGYPEESDEQARRLEEMIAEADESEKIPHEVVQLEWSKKFFERIDKKKKTKKNLLRLEKLKKEIDYLELKLKK